VRLEDSKAEYWNQVRGITAFGTWIKMSKLLGLGKMEVIGSNAEHWNQERGIGALDLDPEE